jgi:hypothetical protein
MTLIGKLLAFLNLFVGLAIVTWATTEYALRPGWFDPVPERVEKGNEPVNFAMLKQETEILGRAADAASGLWGENLKVLRKAERDRDNRRKMYTQRLAWIQKGNPNKGGAASGKDSSTLQLYDEAADGTVTTVLGDPIIGPDNKPLKGVENLLANFSKDVQEVERLALQNAKHRRDYDELSKQILQEDARLDAMLVIRESVQSELFFLATFELNVYETRTTVFNRKRQLTQRLSELGGVPKKN